MAPRFSIIIVNYNGGAYLQGAVDSLARQSVQDFEVFVVDNASCDGSAEALETSAIAKCEVMLETANHGFAKGNNIAARKAKGDWLVLLNPDAEAQPDWLEAIGDAIDRHPGIAMFASLQRSLENPARLDGIGDCYFGFGVPWRGGFGRSAAEIPPEGECFSPCGAGAVYRRDAFLEHGGFDERFFCFGEDTDLAFRMRLAGERCVFLPSAEIHHAGGALSGRVSDFSVRLGSRNRLWTYVKCMPGWSFWLTLPGHLAITSLILARGLMTGRFKSTWRGIWQGLRGLGPVWRQRRQIQRARTAPVTRLLAAMSWNPMRFLRRKGHVWPLKPVRHRPDQSANRPSK